MSTEDAGASPVERGVRPLPPERADFEAWAISAGFAYRNHQGFWFYRNGGDGMWEAYCAGAGDQRGRDAIASRDHLNAIFEDMRPRAA